MTHRPPAQRPARRAPGLPARVLATVPALRLPQAPDPVTALRTVRGGCLAACAAGAVGLPAASVPGVGPALAALLVGAFVLLAPGLAVLPHVGGVRPDGPYDAADGARPGLPRSAAAVLVPITGVSVVVLASTAAAEAGWWHPHAVLALLVALTTLVAAAGTRRPA